MGIVAPGEKNIGREKMLCLPGCSEHVPRPPDSTAAQSHILTYERYSSHYNRSCRPRVGVDVQPYSFFNLFNPSTRWGLVINTTFRPLCLLERDLAAPELVWTGAENLAATGIRSADSLVCSMLLYRLSYPGPWTYEIQSSK